MRWYIAVLRKYADFDGRARRKEFWMYALVNSIVLAALDFLGFEAHTVIPSYIFLAAVTLPTLAAIVRRLHDTGKSGWLLPIGLVPLVGIVLLLIFLCSEGDRGQNWYGLDPKFADRAAYLAPPAAV